MGWIVAPSLARLMQDFRTRFPNKSREQDGTIGDTAHQKEKSGHNPDDTPGVVAEYSDADSIAEVRADDIDSRLNESGASMLEIISRIIATPVDIRRLKYIIHQSKIWSRNTGWESRPYYGSDPHDKHAHFSGDPDYDNDNSPWLSVLNYGGSDMALTDSELGILKTVANDVLWLARRVEALSEMRATYLDPNNQPHPMKAVEALTALVSRPTAPGLTEQDIARISDQLAAETDTHAVEAALRAVLTQVRLSWVSPTA